MENMFRRRSEYDQYNEDLHRYDIPYPEDTEEEKEMAKQKEIYLREKMLKEKEQLKIDIKKAKAKIIAREIAFKREVDRIWEGR